jgi:hypothetical protein
MDHSSNQAMKSCLCLTFRTTNKVTERFERRILDEITKMFNDSMYFSLTGDITNSVQRQASSKDATEGQYCTIQPSIYKGHNM